MNNRIIYTLCHDWALRDMWIEGILCVAVMAGGLWADNKLDKIEAKKKGEDPLKIANR